LQRVKVQAHRTLLVAAGEQEICPQPRDAMRPRSIAEPRIVQRPASHVQAGRFRRAREKKTLRVLTPDRGLRWISVERYFGGSGAYEKNGPNCEDLYCRREIAVLKQDAARRWHGRAEACRLAPSRQSWFLRASVKRICAPPIRRDSRRRTRFGRGAAARGA
jgi:hypothetical protein